MSKTPYQVEVANRFNEALRRFKGHAETARQLYIHSEPHDSDTMNRLRLMYRKARFQVDRYLKLSEDPTERWADVKAVERYEGFDAWLLMNPSGFREDPPPKDHGAGHILRGGEKYRQ